MMYHIMFSILLLTLILPTASSFSVASGFNIPSKASKLNSRHSLKMGVFDIFSNNMGDTWKYSDLFDETKLKVVESVNILPTGKSAYVIDNLHKPGEVMQSNLHQVTLQMNAIGQMIDSLVKHNIDVVNIPENTDFVSAFIDKSGEAAFNIGVYVLVFSVASQFVFRNIQPPNAFNQISKIEGDTFEIIQPNDSNTTFSSVAGCDEAKFELTEVIDFLKNKEKYEELGAKIPKGVLLEGSPGTGKTLMARAIAGEAGVPLISASGSEFIELFVGIGASRVRKLFEKARELSPCVIFIDEIDAIGRQRGAGIAGGNDEREQTLNQMLTNMDGFTQSDGIIVVAATNRADILDNALLRPGRFDRKINVPLPSLEGRKQILGVHLKNKKVSPDINLDDMASLTTGFSGADLSNMVNEAAILAVRNNISTIDNIQLYNAYEKVTIGIQSNVQETDPVIQELVTYHECGHALMVLMFNEMFDLKKVTINSNTNGAGGYTLFTPKEKYGKYATKRFLLANLIIALGGRAAEMFLYRNIHPDETTDYGRIFDGIYDLDVTSGASNDLIQANKLARDYISRYGFGDTYNSYDPFTPELPFMGRELTMTDKISESTRRDIDIQVGALVSHAQEQAYRIIQNNKKEFIKIAKKLKKERTIDGEKLSSLKLNPY